MFIEYNKYVQTCDRCPVSLIPQTAVYLEFTVVLIILRDTSLSLSQQ